MTVHHIFYIPLVFLLGLFFGLLISEKRIGNFREKLQVKPNFTHFSPPKVSLMYLILTLLILIGVFIITHIFPIPYGLKIVHNALGGFALFDKQPSFSGTEVYNRLQAYAIAGLPVYKRFTYTTDLIFPLTFFYFLRTLSRFVAQRISVHRYLLSAIIGLPFIWLGFDLVENSMVFALLSAFPTRNDFIAGILSYVTTIKFGLLFLATLVPPVFLFF